MKKRARLVCSLVVSFFMATAVLAQLPSNVLEGTWEMVSQRLVYPNTVVDQTDRIPYTLKILNSTHFAFGRQIQDEEVYAGGGTYTYDGDTYTEHIRYHSAAGLAGQSITFDARVVGDVWYHEADLGDFVLEEIWQRVDPETE